MKNIKLIILLAVLPFIGCRAMDPEQNTARAWLTNQLTLLRNSTNNQKIKIQIQNVIDQMVKPRQVSQAHISDVRNQLITINNENQNEALQNLNVRQLINNLIIATRLAPHIKNGKSWLLSQIEVLQKAIKEPDKEIVTQLINDIKALPFEGVDLERLTANLRQSAVQLLKIKNSTTLTIETVIGQIISPLIEATNLLEPLFPPQPPERELSANLKQVIPISTELLNNSKALIRTQLYNVKNKITNTVLQDQLQNTIDLLKQMDLRGSSLYDFRILFEKIYKEMKNEKIIMDKPIDLLLPLSRSFELAPNLLNTLKQYISDDQQRDQQIKSWLLSQLNLLKQGLQDKNIVNKIINDLESKQLSHMFGNELIGTLQGYSKELQTLFRAPFRLEGKADVLLTPIKNLLDLLTTLFPLPKPPVRGGKQPARPLPTPPAQRPLPPVPVVPPVKPIEVAAPALPTIPPAPDVKPLETSTPALPARPEIPAQRKSLLEEIQKGSQLKPTPVKEQEAEKSYEAELETKKAEWRKMSLDQLFKILPQLGSRVSLIQDKELKERVKKEFFALEEIIREKQGPKELEETPEEWR